MANWYILRKGTEEGPLSASELRSMVAAGKLQRSDKIRRDDTQDFVVASSVKGLFSDTPHSPPSIAIEKKLNSNQRLPNTSTSKIQLSIAEKSVSVGLGILFGIVLLTFSYFAFRWVGFPTAEAEGGDKGDSKPVNDIGDQLVELNEKIGDWKSKREKLMSLLRDLERDKSSLVAQLRQLGASPTDQKSNDPKGAILLGELRDVLKQSLVFDKKQKDFDFAIFKSESRVRTLERRIAAKDVVGTDEELVVLIRSMMELDESLDSESKDEIPIELDDLIKDALSTSSNNSKNVIPDEVQPKPKSLAGVDLFGRNLKDDWESDSYASLSNWSLVDGTLTCHGDGSSLVTKNKFKDFDFHIEFLLPAGAASGIYLRGRYEVQLIDHLNRSKANQLTADVHTHGAINGLIAPTQIVYMGPNKWNTLDIRLRDRNVTVELNEKIVIQNQKIYRTTLGALDQNESAPGPIMIQSSWVPGVQFRNASIKADPFLSGTFMNGKIDQKNSKNDRSSAINESVSLPKATLYLPCDGSPVATYYKLSGGKTVEGAVGKGRSYDGTQYTEIVHALPLGNSPRTLALWMRNDRGPVDLGIHPISYGPIENGKTFGIMEAAKRWRLFDLNGGLDSGVTVDRNWHHHAITHDGKTIRYFFDGKEVRKTERSLATGNGPLKIGGLGDRVNNFVGVIDEVYIFDVALNEAQIDKLFWKR